MSEASVPPQTLPILLFNGECAVCRSIARWVAASAHAANRSATLLEQPIGDDPAALRSINAKLDIWDAYETIHIVMPNGSMKIGGDAVAEVLRSLPNCRWFAWTFEIKIAGMRPFQAILDFGYTMLAGIRPILGCESCGIPNPWVKALGNAFKIVAGKSKAIQRGPIAPHFTKTHRPLRT